MRNLTIFIIVTCFSVSLSSNSMFMFSIENGEVHTENFSLNHIMKAARSSQDNQSGFGSCRYLSHRHILLTKCAIPEERTFLAGPEIINSGHNFLPAFPSFTSSRTTNNSKIHLGYNSRLEQPVSPLLRSSVLLI